MFTLLFATILLTLQQPTFAADDDMQCTEGFVMDLFCINRGTLLDDPSVVTLQNPEKHSVHCLVDVNVCVNSGYNILLPNPKFGQGSEPKFVHALTLDKTGNDLVVKFAQENGVCSTCTGSGNITAGLRFTYIGKVIPQGDDVAMFQVKNISLSPRIADPNSNDDGCPNAMKRVNISTLFNKSESGDRQDPTIKHDNDTQCTEGFVMDLFCINRGTLLDAPNVVTLQNPEKHSVHCLVDVNVCVNSGYNILLPNPKFGQGSEPKFVHALTLDKTGNDLVVKFAQENGVCSTCTGSGNITAGLRFTYIGKVIPQGDDVAMFQVKNISLSPRIADPNSNDDGCPNAMKRVNISTLFNKSESEDRQDPTIKHDNDTQCTEGFVMDLFCINRGTLLDDPSVVTLQNPEKHSVHCLVDVNVCVNSGYNILLPNPKFGQGSEPKFVHALTLDKTGNDLVVKFAQENGVCSTCTGSGNITAGLRFTYIGKVIPQGDDVAMFQVKNISLSPRIANPNSNDDGCPNAMKRVNISSLFNKSESEDRQDPTIKHDNDTQCTEGFVMDLFCINRGTLLDDPSVVTLQNPEKHSVHCLVDLNVCVNSGYNILLPNPKFGQGSEPKFVHALTLDKTGNDLVVKFAQENGVCSTCTGSGNITAGLRFTYIGKVIPQGDDVAMFQVKNISLSPRIADPNSNDDGCPNAMKRVNISTLFNKSESEDRQDPTIKHDNDTQCTEGFVMDLFCINRGTLLDDPSVVTLQNPEKHSVHCLVDVNVCVNSGYNILLPNPKFGQGSEPKFVHALTLDKTGNDLVVKFARENGVCSTCTGSGNITAGLRFTYIGKVIPQGDDVAMFQVKNISLSPRIADPNSNDDGCPNAMKRVNISSLSNKSESGDRQDPTIKHDNDTQCTEGFVMDLFCINRGTLLDAPSVVTLQDPEKHSVHCLVDVNVCVNSGYNILLPNPKFGQGSEPKFIHALTLDKTGNDLVVKFARENGVCSTCTGSGNIRAGLRFTYIGKVIPQGDDVAMFQVKSISLSPRIADPNSNDDGCPNTMKRVNIFSLLNKFESGERQDPSIAHGSLMIISWGFFLPTVVVSFLLIS